MVSQSFGTLLPTCLLLRSSILLPRPFFSDLRSIFDGSGRKPALFLRLCIYWGNHCTVFPSDHSPWDKVGLGPLYEVAHYPSMWHNLLLFICKNNLCHRPFTLHTNDFHYIEIYYGSAINACDRNTNAANCAFSEYTRIIAVITEVKYTETYLQLTLRFA